MKSKSILNKKEMMKCGMKCTVIEDNNYDDITVQFEDGTTKKAIEVVFIIKALLTQI